jgi:hypothetical protein
MINNKSLFIPPLVAMLTLVGVLLWLHSQENKITIHGAAITVVPLLLFVWLPCFCITGAEFLRATRLLQTKSELRTRHTSMALGIAFLFLFSTVVMVAGVALSS